MDEKYGTDIFTEPTLKGRLGVNAMKANKHLYDHIVYDSTNEQQFATELDIRRCWILLQNSLNEDILVEKLMVT